MKLTLERATLLKALGHVQAVVERRNTIPILSNVLISASNSRNYPLVQGCVLFIAGSYVIVNLVIDLLYAYLDPRIRLS